MTLLSCDFPLTYCMNVHPITQLSHVYQAIQDHVRAIQARVFGEKKMGLGLWFPQSAVGELEENLQDFQAFLEEKNLFAFTLNGFPQRAFHQPSVKEKVYFPTWADTERLEYSLALARILAHLLPSFIQYGSISTLPLHFKGTGGISLQDELDNLIELVAFLHSLKQQFHKHIIFCLEPEPLAYLETTEEVIHFFRNHLFPQKERLAKKLHTTSQEAEKILKAHLGICWDTCHQAVEFEDGPSCLASLRQDGIWVAKVQLSNALEIHPALHQIEDLRPFAEDRYLHQVIGKDRDGKIHRCRDLPEIFGDPLWQAMEVLRLHFHLPIFCREFDGFFSTLPALDQCLEYFLKGQIPVHFEVETYTWDVLPQREKLAEGENLSSLLSRELEGILKKQR